MLFDDLLAPTEFQLREEPHECATETPPPHDCDDVDGEAVPAEVVDLDEVFAPLGGREE